MKRRSKAVGLLLAGAMLAALPMQGCAEKTKDGVVEIELVQYKPEAVDVFEELEEKFNATHDDIHLTIESPNDAMTILKTRFVREDYPDIIGIGAYAYQDLMNTDHTISQIALDNGFCSSRGFAKDFKKRYGVLPNEVQKQKKVKKVL